jgi:hypothetical protein
VRSAEVNLGYATIRAPIAGRTGSLLEKTGNNVSPTGGPLVVINQISPVLVRFPVLSQDFAAIQTALAAHPLHVSAVTSDSTESTDEGTLSFLDNAVDSLTGTVTGKATFQNPGRRLWPGELVFLTITLDVQHNVLAVPTSAIQTGQQGEFVYIVDPTKKALRRPVASGVVAGELTVIRQGLSGGETVIIDGQSRVNPGGRVAIMSAGGDTTRGQQVGGETGGGTVGGEVVPVGGQGGASRAGGAAAGGANVPATSNAIQSPYGAQPANGAQSPNGTQSPNRTPTPAGTQPQNGTQTRTGTQAPAATLAPTGARGGVGAPGSSGAQTPSTTTRPPTTIGRPPLT